MIIKKLLRKGKNYRSQNETVFSQDTPRFSAFLQEKAEKKRYHF